jgi:succinoglycan biosynthesis protein ExoM
MEVTVIVVDNSDNGSGRAVSMAMAPVLPMPSRYIQAHPPNISVARNAGIQASSSEFVAFIDDDEELAPAWLDSVAEGLGRLPCDVLFGPVEAVFEIGERASPAMRKLYSRTLDAEAGTALPPSGPGRNHAVTLGTGNSVFRRSTTLNDPVPFDPAFGRTGGEDYELFCRLQRRGRRFGWLPGAVVSEFVPASRCEEAYLVQRFFTGGRTFAATVARHSGRPRLARWLVRAKAAVQLVTLLPGVLLAHRRPPESGAELRFRLAGVFGKLSLREPVP